LIVLVVAAVFVIAWKVWNRVSLRRIAQRPQLDPLLSDAPSGVPVILYFTTPLCAPCRTQQKPALAQLQAELGAQVEIVQIDASDEPDAASRWGVFSVPTTFVLDTARKPRHVNRGVASTDQLRRQLESLSA
jgi:thioredoxin-like negative regulator of GroEL